MRNKVKEPVRIKGYYYIDFIHTMGFKSACSGVRKNFIGNPVQIGDGPAAVTGDDRCTVMSLTFESGRRSH